MKGSQRHIDPALIVSSDSFVFLYFSSSLVFFVFFMCFPFSFYFPLLIWPTVFLSFCVVSHVGSPGCLTLDNNNNNKATVVNVSQAGQRFKSVWHVPGVATRTKCFSHPSGPVDKLLHPLRSVTIPLPFPLPNCRGFIII